MKRSKVLISLMLVVALLLLPAVALADTEDTVTINATPSFIGIENTPDSFDFETVEAGINEDTGETHFTINNSSSKVINITIVCNDWTGAVNSWTYGAPAENQAQLKASIGSGYNIDVPAEPNPAATLHSNVAVVDDPQWGLQLEAPTSFTFGDEQETTITLTATEA
jgi:hypothetical protein